MNLSLIHIYTGKTISEDRLKERLACSKRTLENYKKYQQMRADRYVPSDLVKMCIRDRLNYACHRLENTSDSITNICLDSGFESQRTFNRVFKERYKISPSDYRSICVKEMLS